MTDPQGTLDFFISYRGPQAAWARWVNWVVRTAGYSTILMDEFQVGTTWTNGMRNAAQNCRRLIPLYSEDYWTSGACVEEFDAYWRQHLQNQNARFLLPLAIQHCTVPDMHAMLLFARLYELDRNAAEQAILKVLQGVAPAVPNAVAFVAAEPEFPGIVATPMPKADWPDAVADLRWPLANHDHARDAFAQLVTRNSTRRLLAIRGESETGKTHLTRQFLNNAQRRVPGCVCGRFDFKGTDDLHVCLNDFAEHLAVSVPPSGGSLTDRLSQVLNSLKQKQAPTLLIFDAFEYAGEADRWIRERILTTLHRSPWLRIVIAGKYVPECHGQSWEEDSLVIPLHPPSPADWYAYGVANQRNVALEFVQQAHNLCSGKSSTLASLLGPQA